MVSATPTSPVNAVQVYLDFDKSVLDVTSVTGGGMLPQELQPLPWFDNSLGQVNYAAGTTGSSIQAAFTLITVNFQAIATTGPSGTPINFAPLAPPRQTKVAVGAGRNVTGNLTPVNLVTQ